MMHLKGMKAVVTGGGSGIGAAIGLAYAKEGADVAFLDVDLDGAKRYAEEAGGQSCAVRADVKDKASVQAAFTEIGERFGWLDIAVCSAGVSVIVPFLDCSEETWDLTMDINLKGMFLCLQSAVPLMPKTGGSIICLSSQSGKIGASQYQAYCASKFGVIGFVQSLALELAPKGIRVNAVCPGVVRTPMWDKQISSYAKKRGLQDAEVMPYFETKIPLGRIGTLEDVSDMAVYLAGKESVYITGQALNVSGGAVMF